MFLFPSVVTTTPRTISLIAGLQDTTNASTYTFSSASLGAVDETRVIICCINVSGNTNPTSVTSVTVAGNSATSILTTSHNDSTGVTAMFAVAVPTGTTGDIVVTLPGGVNRCVCTTYRMVGGDGSVAASTTGTDITLTTNALSTSPDVPANGCALGFSYGRNGTSATWTNLTEDIDTFIESANNAYTSASSNFSAAETGDFTVDYATTPDRYGLLVATWGPV